MPLREAAECAVECARVPHRRRRQARGTIPASWPGWIQWLCFPIALYTLSRGGEAAPGTGISSFLHPNFVHRVQERTRVMHNDGDKGQYGHLNTALKLEGEFFKSK